MLVMQQSDVLVRSCESALPLKIHSYQDLSMKSWRIRLNGRHVRGLLRLGTLAPLRGTIRGRTRPQPHCGTMLPYVALFGVQQPPFTPYPSAVSDGLVNPVFTDSALNGRDSARVIPDARNSRTNTLVNHFTQS